MIINNKGSSMVQYGIIIGIVIIVLIPIFFIFGDTIYRQFESFYLGLKNKDEAIVKQDTSKISSITVPTKPTIVAGSLGGTADVPAMECANGSCNIDYGEFVLEGIPEDFSEFVESHGTSGGTDELLKLIKQIADQLEEKGDEAGAKEFRDLANLGHYMASTEKQFEEAAKKCSLLPTGEHQQTTCINSFSNSDDLRFSVPDNISHLLSKDVESLSFHKILNVGEAKDAQGFQGGFFRNVDENPKEYPALQFLELYESISRNPMYSDNMKKVTQELFLDISHMSYDLLYELDRHKVATSEANIVFYNRKDPLTGKYVDFGKGEGSATAAGEGVENIIKPKISFKTNLNSALICITGKNKDNMVKCK